MTSYLPAAGIRVLDLGIITAGASTSAILADLGADVIKVESASYMDPFRVWDIKAGEGRWWDVSPLYRFTNRNKRCVSLDLKHEEGRALLLALAREADLVVENFRRGVLDRLGVGPAALLEVNPRLVVASVSSQGEDGPDRDAVSFGSTLDATSGLAWLTAYEDGPPTLSGRDVNFPDQVVSVFAAGAILAALGHVGETGRGGHLDLPQRELATFLVGEEIVRAARVGGDRRPRGNEGDEIYWQDCVRAADGVWIAVSVMDADSAASLDLPREPRAFGEALAGWAAERDGEAVIGHMRARGVAAAVVSDSESLGAMPLEAFGSALARSPDGGVAKGFPFQLTGTPLTVRAPAPALGEHTREVLAELLHLSDEEIDRLEREGVTSDRPA